MARDITPIMIIRKCIKLAWMQLSFDPVTRSSYKATICLSADQCVVVLSGFHSVDIAGIISLPATYSNIIQDKNKGLDTCIHERKQVVRIDQSSIAH